MNEADRELLEMAAKAIGEEFDSNHITVSGQQFEWVEWNPLVDDGDALRLAVKLRLCISLNFDGVTVNRGDYGAWIRTGVGSDDERCRAAVRIAIVRTAAEIGKTR